MPSEPEMQNSHDQSESRAGGDRRAKQKLQLSLSGFSFPLSEKYRPIFVPQSFVEVVLSKYISNK